MMESTRSFAQKSLFTKKRVAVVKNETAIMASISSGQQAALEHPTNHSQPASLVKRRRILEPSTMETCSATSTASILPITCVA